MGKYTQLGSPGFWSGSPVVGEVVNLGAGLGTDPEFSPEPALSFQPVRTGLIAPGVVCPCVQTLGLNAEGLGVWTPVSLREEGLGVWIPGSKGGGAGGPDSGLTEAARGVLTQSEGAGGRAEV